MDLVTVLVLVLVLICVLVTSSQELIRRSRSMSIVARSPNVRLPSRSLPRGGSLALLLALGVTSGACDDTSVGTFGIASPALAVVSSDYTTASVSLFNPATGRHVDSCTTSRSMLK